MLLCIRLILIVVQLLLHKTLVMQVDGSVRPTIAENAIAILLVLLSLYRVLVFLNWENKVGGGFDMLIMSFRPG